MMASFFYSFFILNFLFDVTVKMYAFSSEKLFYENKSKVADEKPPTSLPLYVLNKNTRLRKFFDLTLKLSAIYELAFSFWLILLQL